MMLKLQNWIFIHQWLIKSYFRYHRCISPDAYNQLDDDIKSAVLGNAGTVISFRIGTEDAMHMAKEMYPEFDVEDFINLPNYKIYLKLMIDGKPSRPFSAVTMASPN